MKGGRDRGSGTVMGIGVLAASALLSASAMVTIDLLTTATRVQRSADLAALAASDVSMGVVSGQPCDRAREIVRASHFHLAHCLVIQGEAEVRVSFESGLLPVEKRARAAPQQSPVWRDS